MSVFKKILVPIDDSELSEQVLGAAMALAHAGGARVVLLRVVADGARLEPGGTSADLAVIERETEAMEQRALGHLAGAFSGSVQAEVRAGGVVETIVDAARDLMVDLIVMGTHGRHGFTELLTGSTTEQVVAQAPVSVLVMRPTGYPYLRD
jgi:nucleotide-binding universal stress UspA family protein